MNESSETIELSLIDTPLNSLKDLLKALSESSIDQFPQLLRNLSLTKNCLTSYKSWSKDCYKRNHIVKNDRYELILLCWEEGQETPIHDHGGERCWVHFVKGQFSEIIYAGEELKVVKQSILNPGDSSYMNDSIGYHKLINTTKGRAMTLHLYANPINECNVYNKTSNSFASKKLNCEPFKNLISEN